jgi:putative transposase
MARPLRIQYPGACYHVTARGNERRAIFRSRRDREQFLSYLQSAHDRYGAVIHGYCLMDNHYHLLLETPWGNLSQILHHINGAYTTYVNTKWRRSGHLFQGRYKAIVVEKDPYLLELSRYMHLNPVRAGLVKHPSAYRWSSYPSYIGAQRSPEWLTTEFILSSLGQEASSLHEHYRAFVEEGTESKMRKPLAEVFASTFLGSSEFIETLRQKAMASTILDTRNVPVLRQLVERPSVEHIEQTIASLVGRNHPLFRKWCIYLSHRCSGLPLNEIGSSYGISGAAVSQSRSGFEQVIATDKKLKDTLIEMIKRLHFGER